MSEPDPKSDPPRPHGEPADVLIVDDDRRGRTLLEGYLRGEGYRIRSARDGASALALCRERVPDVVLLDVMMPGMNGYEVCSTLKSDPRTRLCQVMLVTALDDTSNKVAGLDTGADDYATKPVRREEFLAKVRALLRARRLLGELECARHELSRRNEELQLKKTLVQSLVHDLKSPLAAILGNLDLLELRIDGTLAGPVRRAKQGTARMLRMVMDLLDVEGLEVGQLVPRIGRHDASEIVRSAVEEATVAASTAGVDVVADVSEATPVLADPHLLRRVIDNLVANAIAHSPENGTVRVSSRRQGDEIEIAVADTGPGVPPAERERVFEKYARLDPASLRSSSNRGLGLTFCRLATEAHGGRIWIDDAPEGGAWFRARFPAASETIEADGARCETAGVGR